MSLISVNNVGKAYCSYKSEWQRFARWFGIPLKPQQENWVLRHISFDIHKGQAIGIIGQNGAGKSTLLKMLAGTLQPTEGEIKINGRISAILELGMGFSPDLTGRQNVYHSAGLMGFSREQIDAAIEEIAAFAEIGEYFDEPVRVYSSGMQARVAFAIATAWRPEVLIVDEALSVGDVYFQAKCFKRINHFKKDGVAFIFVSHSLDSVVKHCERGIFIHNGRVVKDGSSRDVSNVYLDNLFGKEAEAEGDENRQRFFLKDRVLNTDDRFHLNPGYNPEEYRWGVGGAVIFDYLILYDNKEYPESIKGDARVDFIFNVKFGSGFESIIPGFLIKTLDGVFLYGTNSFVASNGRSSISVLAGDVRAFKFSVPLSLAEGFYLVSFGVSSGMPDDQLTPLDRRYDSVIVKITRGVSFWGLANLDASFAEVELNGAPA